MKRIDSRTVEFTEEEMPVKDRFEELLDQGHGIPVAAVTALNEHVVTQHGLLGRSFVAYLSDDTVKVRGDHYVIKAGWR